jgi:hypothetical protein
MFTMLLHTKLWSENLKGREHSENLDIDGRVISEWILGKQSGKLQIKFVWLRIGISGS